MCPAKLPHHQSPSVPRPPFEETTYTSCSISTMACMRGDHTDPLVSREQRPRAFPSQDSSQAPEAQTVPSSEGGEPSIPPQRRYTTRRPTTSPPPKPSVCRIQPKRAKTSSPRDLGMHNLILKPLSILSVLPTLLRKPSSRGLLIHPQLVCKLIWSSDESYQQNL